MSLMVDDAISAWMKKSEASGELKNNPYNGKKFELDDYLSAPKELRMGFKILKDAGYTPPAVALKQAIAATRQAMKETTDDAQREALKLELNALQLKHAVALDGLAKLR